MVLFENDAVVVSLDKETPCLEWIAKKKVKSEEFRESEWESLKHYETYKKEYPSLEWFVDARKVEGLSPEDTEWVADVILPKFANLGLTKEAFVMPSDFFGKLSVEDYASDAADGRVTIHMFDDVEKAKNWLKEK